MKKLFAFIFLSSLSPAPIMAQEVLSSPICVNIRNEAPYRVYGQVATDYYTTPDGTKARHTGTFRLEKKDTYDKKRDLLTDRTQICSSGPFYPGRQLELTLRTLIPIFSCKTSIEYGEIVIQGQIKKDGTSKTWVNCF